MVEQHERNNFQVVQFNCHSIFTILGDFKIFLYTRKPHIVCLCETWTEEGNFIPQFINYNVQWKHRNRRGGAIAILIRLDLVVVPSSLVMFQNPLLEIQRCQIKFHNFLLDIINLYNPNKNISKEEWVHYIVQAEDSKIIIGDFNAHHRNWETGGDSNYSGRQLVEVLSELHDIDLVTPPDLPTYMDPRTGRTSTIDLCVVSANLIARSSIEVGPDLGSDHNPVIATFNHKPVSIPLKFMPKWKLADVKWPEWRDGLRNIQWEEDKDIAYLNNKFITNIKKSKYELQRTTGHYNPKFSKPWWNQECSKLVAVRRKMKNAFRRRPTEENRMRWREAENKAKQQIEKS